MRFPRDQVVLDLALSFRIVAPLIGGIGCREYAIVNRAGLTNQTGPLDLRFGNKSYNFTHVGLQS
jgi:hypothetical protein